MSNQFFQSDSKDIGLFTFYRSQQEQEQKYRNLREKLKEQLHKNEQQRQKQKQKLERSIIDQKQKSQEKQTKLLSKSDSKKKIRQNKSNKVDQVLSRYKKNAQEQINILQKRTNEERLSRQNKIKKISSLDNSFKRSLAQKRTIQSKQKQLLNKQLHKITLQQQRIFLHTPQPSKSTLRQRMHTHFDNHFRKKLDKSKEQEAIKIKLFPQQFKRKNSNKVPIKTFKEKLLFLDSNPTNQLLSEQEQQLMASKTHKQLHEQNKKYFNSLIENDYLRPEYNQTAYRILRDTLKLPLVSNSRRYIKTEQNSPSCTKPQSPKRSSSFFKKIISKNQIFKQSLKQFTQKHNSKVLVKGSLITQQTFGK